MNAHAGSADAPPWAVIFEPYGTLLDVETDERDWYAYLNLARFLEYRGVRLNADELRWLWFEKLSQGQQSVPIASGGGNGPHPEADARTIWREIIEQHRDPCYFSADSQNSSFLSEIVTLQRALVRRTLRLMDGAKELLERLHGRVRLGVIADGQPEYVVPELQIAGIEPYFEAITVSGAHGYRKPDQRLFANAVKALGATPERTVMVGVDTARDIAGATAARLRSVLVLSPYGTKDIALGTPDYDADSTAVLAPLLERMTGIGPHG